MKARIRTLFDNILFTPKPFIENNYQATIKLSNGVDCRMHLRVEHGGIGILILNASSILHLNPTATEFAYHLLQHDTEEVVIKEIVKRYRVSVDQAQADYHDFIARLESLITTPDLDPETFLDIDRIAVHEGNLSAPLRLDCALTYQVTSGTSAIYAPTDRVKRLLDTEEWKTILQKAWSHGIPHVVFTGGEPTLRPDLSELVSYSQEIGQVTGLITDGSRLSDHKYLSSLLDAGLDHLMVVLDPNNDTTWESIKDVIAEDIFLTVHLTLSKQVEPIGLRTIEKLHKLNVKSISLSSDSKVDKNTFDGLTQKAQELGMSLVWDLPVPYSEVNPISLELENSDTSRKGAGNAWLYIEPDGDVLPAQGINHVLGNLLTDSWEKIWAAAKLH
jgi:MoaA/NifB/PqqE/SkfB family radical SAM enzyme